MQNFFQFFLVKCPLTFSHSYKQSIGKNPLYKKIISFCLKVQMLPYAIICLDDLGTLGSEILKSLGKTYLALDENTHWIG